MEYIEIEYKYYAKNGLADLVNHINNYNFDKLMPINLEKKIKFLKLIFENCNFLSGIKYEYKFLSDRFIFYIPKKFKKFIDFNIKERD